MVKITWLGHSAVKLEGKKTVFIDPFITGNRACSCTLEDIEKADMVFVTHDHGDHLGDAFAICQKTGATLVAMHEIAEDASEQGIPSEGMNIGGTVEVEGVKFNMTSALHSAGKGTPCGVVVEIDGFRIYHAGDTGLMLDMKLIGEFFEPDLSFLPIGDRYTMGIESAAKAVELLKTRRVIPIHYDTFEGIRADPQAFKTRVGSLAEVIVLRPGEHHHLAEKSS